MEFILNDRKMKGEFNKLKSLTAFEQAVKELDEALDRIFNAIDLRIKKELQGNLEERFSDLRDVWKEVKSHLENYKRNHSQLQKQFPPRMSAIYELDYLKSIGFSNKFSKSDNNIYAHISNLNDLYVARLIL